MSDPASWLPPEAYAPLESVMRAPTWAFAPAAEHDIAINGNDDHEGGLVRPFVPTLLDIRNPPAAPRLIHRFLYAGCLTSMVSEPGVGKSLLSQWITADLIAAGQPVVLFDEEGGKELATERLALLGADPDAVSRRLRYYPFEGRKWDADDLAALDQLIRDSGRPPVLAVFDSLPDFLAASDRSEDSAYDVTSFVNMVLRRFLSAGIAVLVLDHLRKPDQDAKRRTRSRYARGSGAKLAKSDATLLLETVDPFDANTSGRLRIWKTKDRRGRLQVPDIHADGLDLVVKVGDNTISIEVEEGAERADGPAWNGPTECMAVVLDALTVASPEEMTGAVLIDRMKAAGRPFRAVTVREAAERLAVDGAITVRNGPRNSRLFSWHAAANTQEASLGDEV